MVDITVEILAVSIPITKGRLRYKLKTWWAHVDVEELKAVIKLPQLPMIEHYYKLSCRETIIFIELWYANEELYPMGAMRFLGLAKCPIDNQLKNQSINPSVQWLEVHDPIEDIVRGRILLRVNAKFSEPAHQGLGQLGPSISARSQSDVDADSISPRKSSYFCPTPPTSCNSDNTNELPSASTQRSNSGPVSIYNERMKQLKNVHIMERENYTEGIMELNIPDFENRSHNSSQGEENVTVIERRPSKVRAVSLDPESHENTKNRILQNFSEKIYQRHPQSDNVDGIIRLLNDKMNRLFNNEPNSHKNNSENVNQKSHNILHASSSFLDESKLAGASASGRCKTKNGTSKSTSTDQRPIITHTRITKQTSNSNPILMDDDLIVYGQKVGVNPTSREWNCRQIPDNNSKYQENVSTSKHDDASPIDGEKRTSESAHESYPPRSRKIAAAIFNDYM